ncbi:MAG: hypothetical protein WD042_03335 [Phycisphaeraceae bacterium]
MGIKELEIAVTRLSPEELTCFASWFEEFMAQAWDEELEADVAEGKLDHLAKQADEHFESGRCTEL